MISVEQWKIVDASSFESLALEHVRDIYPIHNWRSTKTTGDGGKDGIGETLEVDTGIKEIYWMEAKHKPGKSSIGKYTLDTHLISTFFTGGRVKRLHIVTSGKLSGNFLIRANIFATKHNFEFAFSDKDALEDWLKERPDIIKEYFNWSSGEILNLLSNKDIKNRNLFGRAFIFPERGSFEGFSSATEFLIPGLKYVLVVAFSVSRALAKEAVPITLSWQPDLQNVYLFDAKLGSEDGIILKNLPKQSIFVFPFRLLRYGKQPLPAPFVKIKAGKTFSIPIKGTKIIPRIVSPFVGNKPREFLIEVKKNLENRLSQNQPSLLVLSGRGGSGKSRLAEEILDEGIEMGLLTKSIQFSSSNLHTQSEQWRLIIRWIFGLEYNPFEIEEKDLINYRLNSLGIDLSEADNFRKLLLNYLINGEFNENLFNLDNEVGKWLADVICIELSHRLHEPTIIHIEDAHRLVGQYLSPLYLLKHLIDSRDTLPLFIIISCRTDETIEDKSILHFIQSISINRSKAFLVHEVKDLSIDDAKELVSQTLLWPELQTSESIIANQIIQRVGTNPFLLMQMIHYIAIDKSCISFGYEDHGFLVNIPVFKKALKSIPEGISNILSERLSGLKKHYGNNLITILTTTALVGREATRKLVERGLNTQIDSSDIEHLLTLGYLSYADQSEIVLSHDLLVENLLKCSEIESTAKMFSKNIDATLASEMGDLRCARVFFHAGSNYYEKSWEHAVRLVNSASEKQEYLSISYPIELLEKISVFNPKAFKFSNEFALAAAYMEQHCGNTRNALERFMDIRKRSRKMLNNLEPLIMYIKATIEASNQHFLRLEITEANKLCKEAISLLNDEAIPLEPIQKEMFLALAHNRLGAINHLTENVEVALLEFNKALHYSKSTNDYYLFAHTYWNIASLLRFWDPNKAAVALYEARDIWKKKLQLKERFRVMLDTSEAYSGCLHNNSTYSRARLFAVASEASEKGYIFQASSALLCYACSCLISQEWEDAKEALFFTLNLSAISEDYKSRLFAYHYLTICAKNEGDLTQAFNYSWQATEVQALADDLMDHSVIKQAILHNYTALGKGKVSKIPKSPLIYINGNLVWYLFNRA